jgi:hypothetical protein
VILTPIIALLMQITATSQKVPVILALADQPGGASGVTIIRYSQHRRADVVVLGNTANAAEVADAIKLYHRIYKETPSPKDDRRIIAKIVKRSGTAKNRFEREEKLLEKS